MASHVHDFAVDAKPGIGASVHTTTPIRNQSRWTPLVFIVFLAVWYGFSPFLPHEVKEFFFAILH